MACRGVVKVFVRRYSGGGPPSGGAPPPSGHQSWDDHSCTKYLPQVSCYLLHVQNTPQGPTPGIGWCSRYFLWLDQFGKSCFGGGSFWNMDSCIPRQLDTGCHAQQMQKHKDKYTKTIHASPRARCSTQAARGSGDQSCIKYLLRTFSMFRTLCGDQSCIKYLLRTFWMFECSEHYVGAAQKLDF